MPSESFDQQPYQSRNLPATQPLEGRVLGLEPTPGKYGHAEVAGVPLGVVAISLRLGAVIFRCALMQPAVFAFTIEPGVPARIYGTDGSLIVAYEVPGVFGGPRCDVRPGDRLTLDLPCRLTDIDAFRQDPEHMIGNRMHAH